MKNFSLYISAIIFLVFGIGQYLRFNYGLALQVGTHHIPLDYSLYAAIVFGFLGLWMLMAASLKN